MSTTKHRVGWYNVEFGHPVNPHAQMILDRFESEQLDVLALIEVQDYVARLQQLIKPAGHRLLTIHNRRGSQNIAILVRKGRKVGNYWTFIAGKPYFRTGGGKMAPTMPLAAHVDGCLYVAVHAPVEAWVARPGGRKFVGPALRRAAYAFFVTRLALLFSRHPNTPIVMMGDWNATPFTVGKWSPGWLRDRVRGVFIRPGANTGHGEIDFAIGRKVAQRGCQIKHDHVGMPHSDHRLVVASIEF